jgi:hypothetical protein
MRIPVIGGILLRVPSPHCAFVVEYIFAFSPKSLFPTKTRSSQGFIKSEFTAVVVMIRSDSCRGEDFCDGLSREYPGSIPGGAAKDECCIYR